jgi:uncharacterized protein (DUF934 family)
MPRRLLRDGHVVLDDWHYLGDGQVGDSAVPAADPDAGGLILSLQRWLGERAAWLNHAGRLGVVLQPADKIEQLASDISRFALIAAEFPGPTDGRGYTQGRLLRERYLFKGELRAAGYVRRDQLFLLARCGFNSFELPEDQLATASSAFSTFTAEYQPSNDAGLARKLQRR